MPVERAFFPQIDVSHQEDGDVDEHLHEAEDSKAVRNLEHVAVNVGPRVQEDRFHIEQNKNHGHEIKLYGERLARVAGGIHTALIRLLLGAIWASPSHQDRKRGQGAGERHREDEVYEKRSVRM